MLNLGEYTKSCWWISPTFCENVTNYFSSHHNQLLLFHLPYYSDKCPYHEQVHIGRSTNRKTGFRVCNENKHCFAITSFIIVSFQGYITLRLQKVFWFSKQFFCRMLLCSFRITNPFKMFLTGCVSYWLVCSRKLMDHTKRTWGKIVFFILIPDDFNSLSIHSIVVFIYFLTIHHFSYTFITCSFGFLISIEV